MAELRYANVYFHGTFAGVLREEPDGSSSFSYHPGYIEAGHSAIAHHLPLQLEPLRSAGGLHPYFDNLVAEGWLAHAQARSLGIPSSDSFGRLLAFGHDCIGATSVLDPRPRTQPDLRTGSPEELAALASRASISGVQPKLLAVRGENGFRPAGADESSTHIAKMPSGRLPGIVEIEYLTIAAAAELLHDDRTVDLEIAPVAGVRGDCLLVRRFDRTPAGGRIHFEEFNQLLDRPSDAKYEGAYSEMADFMRARPRCDPLDIDRLFRRVLAAILVGNQDAHMKNFGLLYEGASLRLAPVYDFVSGALYPEFDSQLALRIGPGSNPSHLGALGPKHVEALAQSFGFGRGALLEAVHGLGARMEAAAEAVNRAPAGSAARKKRIVQLMRKRWNGTFNSIGRK